MSEAMLLAEIGGRRRSFAADRVVAVLDAPVVQPVSPLIPALRGMITFGGAPIPLLVFADGADGPVLVLQADGHNLGCRVDAIHALAVAAPPGYEPVGEAELALWADLPAPATHAAALPMHRAPPPPPPDPAVMLTLRLGGDEVHLPVSKVVKLLPWDEAVLVLLPGPPPPAPFLPIVLLHEAEACAVLDLGDAPAPGTTLVLIQDAASRYAFAAEAVQGLGAGGGELLPLPSLPGGSARPSPPQLAEQKMYLEVVLGGRSCLLPLQAVGTVLPAEPHPPLPGLPGGAMRAVAGRVLPGCDARAALGLSQSAPLAHDVTLELAGMPPCFLPVEAVVALVQAPLAAERALPGQAGLVTAVVETGGRRLWRLAPERLPDLIAPI